MLVALTNGVKPATFTVEDVDIVYEPAILSIWRKIPHISQRSEDGTAIATQEGYYREIFQHTYRALDYHGKLVPIYVKIT